MIQSRSHFIKINGELYEVLVTKSRGYADSISIMSTTKKVPDEKAYLIIDKLKDEGVTIPEMETKPKE
jgi:hypothetical protein